VSLRLKIATVMAVAVLLMAGLNAAVLIPVYRSFAELEQAEARRNSERVQRAIAAELQHMARSVIDWAAWDDTYEFVGGRNPAYVEENLYFETLKSLDFNLAFVYDRAGNILWGEAYDLDTGEPLSIPQLAPGALRPEGVLLANTARDGTVTGILSTDAGPMLVASSPILPSEDLAPANGTFLFGRLLDEALIAQLREQANADFEVMPLTAAEKVPHQAALGSALSIEDAGPELLISRVTLTDVYGQPVLDLRTKTPRDISRIGNRSIGISLLSLLLIATVDFLLLWVLLRRLVLRPVTGITERILEIGKTGALDKRVPVFGNDELGALAREFNRMLDRLSEANKQLVEQSHRTGMAEMAAGVLHNLRNGLSPLVGRLDLLSDTLRNAPGGELRRAVEEFNNPQTDPARKERLLSYVAATGDSFLALKETTLAELSRATALASKLGEIVKHQDKFIYSSSSVEPLPVRDVLRDALELLPPRLASSIGIDVDSAIDSLPPVTAERIALMQVFHNLLLNAIEAIQAAQRPDGRIKITAVGAAGTPGMIDVQVHDNGTGIDTGNLTRIFERGYTTKPRRAGGLGLHWCANTVINMHGRLHAESDGNGNGTTFHLLLPIAEQGMAAE